MTNPSTQKMRTSALNFATSFSDCKTVASLLGKAACIRDFLEESSYGAELRLEALTAAWMISLKWEAGMPECDLITDARAFLAFLDGSGTAVAQVFEAMQAGQVYVRTIRAPDGSLVGTVPLSPSEAVSHAMGCREKSAMPKAELQADRSTPSLDRAEGAPAPAPEIQPVKQPSAPASR